MIGFESFVENLKASTGKKSVDSSHWLHTLCFTPKVWTSFINAAIGVAREGPEGRGPHVFTISSHLVL